VRSVATATPCTSGLLGPGQQALGRAPDDLAARADHLGVLAARRDERAGQAALGGQIVRQDAQPAGERFAGGWAVGQFLTLRADRADLSPEDFLLQVQAGGEVPVQGADPDSGPARDVLQRRVGAVFRERRGGRGQQALMAASRVRPHRRRGRPGGLARGRFCCGPGGWLCRHRPSSSIK